MTLIENIVKLYLRYYKFGKLQITTHVIGSTRPLRADMEIITRRMERGCL